MRQRFLYAAYYRFTAWNLRTIRNIPTYCELCCIVFSTLLAVYDLIPNRQKQFQLRGRWQQKEISRKQLKAWINFLEKYYLDNFAFLKISEGPLVIVTSVAIKKQRPSILGWIIENLVCVLSSPGPQYLSGPGTMYLLYPHSYRPWIYVWRKMYVLIARVSARGMSLISDLPGLLVPEPALALRGKLENWTCKCKQKCA